MAAISITDPPAAPDYARFAEGFGPRFLVTIDTEEEFDWGTPTARSGHRLEAVPALRRFQEFCEGFGVVPLYLMDHPVAACPAAAAAIGPAVAAGKAEAGVHLHPWVNPPFDEELSEYNSFAGNLEPALESAKLDALLDVIRSGFAGEPRFYRAGRYGAGPNTAQMLAGAGLAIDSSVRALFDYSATGGPDYSAHPLHPYWLDRAAGLVELPVTSVYAGALRRLGRRLYPAAGRVPRLRGLLARLGLLERIPLTPEGLTLAEARRGIDIALAHGLPVLVFLFHSPSLAPGNTPYVRSQADLDAFYAWWRGVFAHLARRGVRPACSADILAALERPCDALASGGPAS